MLLTGQHQFDPVGSGRKRREEGGTLGCVIASSHMCRTRLRNAACSAISSTTSIPSTRESRMCSKDSMVIYRVGFFPMQVPFTNNFAHDSGAGEVLFPHRRPLLRRLHASPVQSHFGTHALRLSILDRGSRRLLCPRRAVVSRIMVQKVRAVSTSGPLVRRQSSRINDFGIHSSRIVSLA